MKSEKVTETPSGYHNKWESRIAELQSYTETNGHFDVPISYGSLGIFVSNQRRGHKLLLEGKPSLGMTRERAKKLEELGFKWSTTACTQKQT